MNPRWYGLIMELCLWTAVICVFLVCAFLVDEATGLYKLMINALFVLAGVMSLVTYFYNQHILRE